MATALDDEAVGYPSERVFNGGLRCEQPQWLLLSVVLSVVLTGFSMHDPIDVQNLSNFLS